MIYENVWAYDPSEAIDLTLTDDFIEHIDVIEDEMIIHFNCYDGYNEFMSQIQNEFGVDKVIYEELDMYISAVYDETKLQNERGY